MNHESFAVLCYACLGNQLVKHILVLLEISQNISFNPSSPSFRVRRSDRSANRAAFVEFEEGMQFLA